jgi:hypothetical protein
VSEDDGRRGVELHERFVDQVGLRVRGPERAARAPAVAISRPVEDDDAILLGGLVKEPARLEVLEHASVAVQQDERFAFATLDIVQADTIDLEESSLGGIAALRILGKPTVDQRRDGEGGDADIAAVEYG